MLKDYSEDILVQENAAETFEALGWESYLGYDNDTGETLEKFSKDNISVGLQADNRHIFLGRENQEELILKPYLIQALKDNNDWIKDDETALEVIKVLETYPLVSDINMIVEQNKKFYELLLLIREMKMEKWFRELQKSLIMMKLKKTIL